MKKNLKIKICRLYFFFNSRKEKGSNLKTVNNKLGQVYCLMSIKKQVYF